MRANVVEERGIDTTDMMSMMTSIIRRVDRTLKTIMFEKVIMKVEVPYRSSIAFQTKDKQDKALPWCQEILPLKMAVRIVFSAKILRPSSETMITLVA